MLKKQRDAIIGIVGCALDFFIHLVVYLICNLI